MENVVLIIHLLLALGLIGVVLMQRSEGGGLGIGGGGGGATTGRTPQTALGKLTWVFGIAFTITSITLTIFAAQNSAGTSVIDRLGIDRPPEATETLTPPAGDLTPPAPGDTAPLVPQLD